MSFLIGLGAAALLRKPIGNLVGGVGRAVGDFFDPKVKSAFGNTKQAHAGLLKTAQSRVLQSGGNVTDTPLFNAGLGNLNEILRSLQRADVSRSAGAGTLGTEADIAQSGVRSQALSRGVRDLIGLASNDQRVRDQQAFTNLFGVLRAIDENSRFDRALQERKRQQNFGLLSQGVGSIVSAFAPTPTG